MENNVQNAHDRWSRARRSAPRGLRAGAAHRQPIGLTPDTVQYQLSQEQLRSATGDPGRAQQNPVAIGASPGVGGIVREGTGTGGTGAGAPVSVSPGVGGIQRAPGVGAPTR